MSASTKTLTLAELSEEQLALDDLAAMDDGEWTPELEDLANNLMDKLMMKADSFGGYLKDLEARTDVIKEEVKRLQARGRMHLCARAGAPRSKSLESRVRWMKSYAVSQMLRMNRPKIEGALFTVAIQKNPPSVEVAVLPDALPEQYVRIVPEQREADKRALLDACKRGEEIAGVKLADPTYSLRVR